MVSGLELFMSDTIVGIFGDLTLLGVFFLAIFTATVLMINSRLDFKISILIPIMILAVAFIPFLMVFVGFTVGGLVFLAITKYIKR